MKGICTRSTLCNMAKLEKPHLSNIILSEIKRENNHRNKKSDFLLETITFLMLQLKETNIFYQT